MLNHSFKYDHLEDILRRREQSADQWAADLDLGLGLPANMVPVHQFVMPWFYRLFPATSISIKRGAMMIGNPELPTMLVVVRVQSVRLEDEEDWVGWVGSGVHHACAHLLLGIQERNWVAHNR